MLSSVNLNSWVISSSGVHSEHVNLMRLPCNELKLCASAGSKAASLKCTCCGRRLAEKVRMLLSHFFLPLAPYFFFILSSVSREIEKTRTLSLNENGWGLSYTFSLLPLTIRLLKLLVYAKIKWCALRVVYSFREQPKQREEHLHPSAKILLSCRVIILKEMLKVHGLSNHDISWQCCQDL